MELVKSWGYERRLCIHFSTGEQETIIKPDHQFAFHLGYERFLNENNSLTIKGGRSFRYPNIDERIGAGSIYKLTILDFHLRNP